MDREKVKRDWAAIVQAMPGVQRLIGEKRVKFGDAHVNQCWKHGVLAGEPGWFYAREGGVAVGTPWGDPLYFEALQVTRTQALLMIREPGQTIDEKVEHVKREAAKPDHSGHGCHWPGCDKPVPPAMWGCREHWYTLPKPIRNRIWQTYQTGQEISKTPSREYIEAAREAQEWIRQHEARNGAH